MLWKIDKSMKNRDKPRVFLGKITFTIYLLWVSIVLVFQLN